MYIFPTSCVIAHFYYLSQFPNLCSFLSHCVDIVRCKDDYARGWCQSMLLVAQKEAGRRYYGLLQVHAWARWGHRAIPWENVPYDLHNFATFSSLVTTQEWFSPILCNRWRKKYCHKLCRTGRRETLQFMHLFCVYFITKWHFPQDYQLIYCFNSSILWWVWNKPSFHICLDYRMENNMKMTKISSTESPIDSRKFTPLCFCFFNPILYQNASK